MKKHEKLNVLVVDDQEVNRRLIGTKLSQDGHSVVFAKDGGEAIEKVRENVPDLILMDVMMPGIDGFQATRTIRAESGDYHIPIIFLSAMNDKEHILEGLSIGDDYIAKPLSLDILEARIDALSRLVSAQKQMLIAKRETERMFGILDEENKVAVHVMERLILNTENIDEKKAKHIVIPEGDFSGDLIFSRNTPTGKTNFLLADAVGHGLPAAINILPVFYAFDEMSKKGIPISLIAREMNKRIKEMMPIDRFVCAALISVDFHSGTVETWNAGCPTIFWVDKQGAVIEMFKAAHLPLGLNPDRVESFETFLFNVEPGDQIIAFSDGVSEIIDLKKTCEESLPPLIYGTRSEDRFDLILDTAITNGQTDDMSLLSITFPENFTRLSGNDEFRATPSKFSMTFGHDLLSMDDCENKALKTVLATNIVMQCPNFEIAFIELFKNSLEHGVLKMRTSDYSTTDEYRQEKHKRMETLMGGFIEVDVMIGRRNGNKIVRLTIRDSGNGFNHSKINVGSIQELRKHCSIEYAGNGSEVTAEMSCKED